jgi:hypothetical protein
MTDCDLCGRAIPTVIPVRAIRPLLKFAYPNGVWKGLCETCLDSAQKTHLTVDKNQTSCRKGRCALCGDKTGVFPVELQVPDFSKGVVKKEVNICNRCLKAVDEAYLGHKREQIEQEHAHSKH